MRIKSPKDLHYPITVSKLLKQPGDAVDKSAPLFAFTYQSKVTETNRYGDEEVVTKTLPAEFQSETGGKLITWSIKEGDVIEKAGTLFVDIEEPCKHEIQYFGLCSICGKDMTKVDYNTTQPNDQRATISMQPRQAALKVSEEEANKASELARKRLLDARKLSLVVDLDQTIIHATVDPTVAEWQKDQENPNYQAVKDVKSFKLNDGGPGARGCNYYIKLRPGLEEFLQEVSKKYELHIYTMGTGPYAQNIADIIDPDHKIFGDRILSRDESGSLTLKTLHRLFPMDQRMVVIIDDRGDIWNWSRNLIKVNPYDFFVGIGDINSSFLPKRQDVGAPSENTKSPAQHKVKSITDSSAAAEDLSEAKEEEEPPASQATVSSIDQQLVAMAGSDNPVMLEERTHQQEEAIAAQLSDRPLLRQQEELDKQEEEEENIEQNGVAQSDTPSESGSQRPRHNLLRDDDVDLMYIRQSLERVHQAFYDEYERRATGSLARIAELRGDKSNRASLRQGEPVPDIAEIMPQLKMQVLKDVVILFTGVIPQGMNHQTSDIGIWAQTFGATISPTLNRSTTHVIAHKDRRTSKVRQAAKHSHIKIVTTKWLFDCFARWEKVDEAAYMLDVEREGHTSRDCLPFEDLPDLLSSSASDDDGEELGTDLDDEDFAPPPLEDNESPIEMTDNQWSAINDELDEFLKSEGDDDEGFQSDVSMASAQSQGTGTRPSTPSGRRKRKRTIATDSASASDADEPDSDASVNGALAPGSKLEHRRKRARNRHSALNNATSARSDKSSGLPSPDTTGPEEGHGDGHPEKAAAAPAAATAATEEEIDDDAFEQALMDEFEREETEAEAEAEDGGGPVLATT